MGKILVTCGTGFIGSHTCVELLNNKYDIAILDNFSNSKPEVLNRIKQITNKEFDFYKGDLLNKNDIEKIFVKNDINAVIHFAGLKAVNESISKPIKYYQNNITGTLNLIDIMKKYNCKKIVFSSSTTVYGNENPAPYVETMTTHTATNPYGYTKVMIEQILKDVSNADNDWSIMCLRYFNPIGAHSSGLLGEDPNGIPNNLFPYIQQVAIGKCEALNIFGDNYNTHDGTGVRDYIHVVDLAKGHICAVNYILNHKGIETVNLGTGKGSSVFDVLHAFEKACNKTLPYNIKPKRDGDVALCYADPTKAKELLGWVAQYTLDDMCKDGWNFIKQNPNGLE